MKTEDVKKEQELNDDELDNVAGGFSGGKDRIIGQGQLD